MKIPTFSQTVLDAKCHAQRDYYLSLTTGEAGLLFASQVAGWVASQVERGERFDDTLERVEELLEMLRNPNPDDTYEH